MRREYQAMSNQKITRCIMNAHANGVCVYILVLHERQCDNKELIYIVSLRECVLFLCEILYAFECKWVYIAASASNNALEWFSITLFQRDHM